MQFLKSFIIISLIYLFTIVICYEKSIPQKSKLLNPIEKIFHRKRRFIVFPNYSAVKLTIALSKTLIVKYPKGVGLTIEVSTYYPLQTMLEEWYPKKFRSSTTPKPSITTENIKSNVKYYYPDNSIKWSQFNNEGEIIFIPDDNQWYDFNNFSLPINKDKIWNKQVKFLKEIFLKIFLKIFDFDFFFLQNHNYYPTQNWKSYNNNRKNWTPKYSYKNNTKWNNSWNQNYRNPSKYNRWNQTSHHYKNHNPYNNQRFIPHTHLNTENDNTFKYWKHLKGHRDRRELFEHFKDLGNK